MAVKLGQICQEANINLVLLRQYGMIGYLRLFTNQDPVVEAKYAQVQFKDLRAFDPWPELVAHADSIDLSNLSDVEYNHVPYIVILIKAC